MKKLLSLVLATALLFNIFAVNAIAVTGESSNAQDEVTVVFNPNHPGATIIEQKVAIGALVEAPAAPSYANYKFVAWYTARSGGQKFDFTQPVTEDITLYAMWSLDPNWIGIMKETDMPKEDPEGTVYTVTFDLNYEGAPDPTEQQVVKGEKAQQPINPIRDGYLFAGWFTEKSSVQMNSLYTFFKPINNNMRIYAGWINGEDTDGDGLPNEVENKYGTDVSSIDTDGDGLTDYEELALLWLNPLIKDTDSNGVEDGNEDPDNDGLTNLDELRGNIKTDPTYSDSDYDGLDDRLEQVLYFTNPLADDTDGDGAIDGIEVYYSTDPLAYNESFIMNASSEELSENNPVAASVIVRASGEALGTVSVESVSNSDNPFVNSTIAGYLGSAYDFSASGEIVSAEITFEYDTSLGEVGEDFQPRIYYFNEDSNEFEELENQRVENGKVTATTSHFSTYILLNKVEFDKVWNEDIKAPIISGGTYSNLDIVFVIDTSGSMSSYSRLITAKTALRTFVSALSEKDRAALVKFSSYATTVIDLVQDKDKIDEKIDSLYASGQTSMYKGLESAINILSRDEESLGYKMIIILSDGKDEPSTTYQGRYANLVDLAIDNNIVIYTVGAGTSVDTSILTKIAENTGGSYYAATMTSGITDAFVSIKGDTVDLTADKNEDGIPDYYNDLIFTGELVLSNGSNEYSGYNFNFDGNGELSDDYDGDGLKNGEEIRVVKSGNIVYLELISDPTLIDSDFDGVDDYHETINGSNPLLYSYFKSAVDNLLDDNIYCGHALAEAYDTNISVMLFVNLNDALSFNWNSKKACKELYLDYFYDYASFNDQVVANEYTILMNNAKTTLSDINKMIGYITKAKKNLIDNPTKKLQELSIMRSQLNYILNEISIAEKNINQSGRLEKLAGDWLELTQRMNSEFGIATTLSTKITDIADKYQHFMNKKNFTGLKNSTTISVVTTTLNTVEDVVSTIEVYSKLKANTNAFAENLDVLAYMSMYGNRLVAQQAAQELYVLVNDELEDYDNQLEIATREDVLMGGTKFALNALVKLNPYTAAIKTVYDVADLIVGTSHMAKSIDNALYYESLITAMRTMVGSTIKYGGPIYYDCRLENHEVSDRYLTHLAQLRIVAEKCFVDYTNNKGLIGWFFDGGHKEAIAWENNVKSNVNGYASQLNLTLSSSLSTNNNNSGFSAGGGSGSGGGGGGSF